MQTRVLVHSLDNEIGNESLATRRVAPTKPGMVLAVWTGIRSNERVGDRMAARPKGPRESIGLRIPVALRPALADAAAARGQSQNDYIVGLIAAALDREDLIPPVQEVLPLTG